MFAMVSVSGRDNGHFSVGHCIKLASNLCTREHQNDNRSCQHWYQQPNEIEKQQLIRHDQCC